MPRVTVASELHITFPKLKLTSFGPMMHADSLLLPFSRIYLSFGSDSLFCGSALASVVHVGLVYVISTNRFSAGEHHPYK